MAESRAVRLTTEPDRTATAAPEVTRHGDCISCPGGCPVSLCACGHKYHGHASIDAGPRRCLNCTDCPEYRPPVCGSQCPTHDHTCQRSPGHQEHICRDQKQKNTQSCSWSPETKGVWS